MVTNQSTGQTIISNNIWAQSAQGYYTVPSLTDICWGTHSQIGNSRVFTATATPGTLLDIQAADNVDWTNISRRSNADDVPDRWRSALDHAAQGERRDVYDYYDLRDDYLTKALPWTDLMMSKVYGGVPVGSVCDSDQPEECAGREQAREDKECVGLNPEELYGEKNGGGADE